MLMDPLYIGVFASESVNYKMCAEFQGGDISKVDSQSIALFQKVS
jgi:hypothetical protein